MLSAVCVDRAGSAGLDPIPTWVWSFPWPDQALLGAVCQQTRAACRGTARTALTWILRASGHRKESVGPHVVCDCHGVADLQFVCGVVEQDPASAGRQED